MFEKVLVGDWRAQTSSELWSAEVAFAVKLDRAKVAMAVDPQQPQAVDSEARGPTTGAQRRGLSGTTGRHAQSEQTGGSAATATASARLTRRKGIPLQAQRLAGAAGRGASTAGVGWQHWQARPLEQVLRGFQE